MPIFWHLIDPRTDTCTCGDDAGVCLGDDAWPCQLEEPCAHCAYWMERAHGE